MHIGSLSLVPSGSSEEAKCTRARVVPVHLGFPARCWVDLLGTRLEKAKGSPTGLP